MEGSVVRRPCWAQRGALSCGQAAPNPAGDDHDRALCRYISDPGVRNFQPMGANFGVLPPLEIPIRDKRERYGALAARALADLAETLRLLT